MGETVRVVVRCRPMNKRETVMKCKSIVHFEKCTVSLSNPQDLTAPEKTFTYDNVYGPDAQTEAIYNDICYSLIENVLEGYNGTIFAYGQTGCGKSHTMQGPEVSDPNLISSSQRGIISRSFDHIFEAISVSSDVRYLVLASYLEIYNENIRDLLQTPLSSNDANSGGQQQQQQQQQQLHLKEIPGGGVIVQNLSTHAIHNAQECEQLLRVGMKNRIVGSTLMNAGSSRSHSIFTISLEQIETKSNLEGPLAPNILKGKLNLVDLAGSERQNKTGATGDRLKEATKINLSLSALGNVISALVDGKTKHIPYRDSKLTRLLQDSLGGNTKTLMIACISPADYNYDETLSTLRYANRAKNIQNKPRINEDPKDTMLREYQREILELRKLLESNGTSPKSPVNQNLWLEQEGQKLHAQYEAETSRLKAEYVAQQKEKEDLVRDMESLKIHYEKQLQNLANNEINNHNKNTVNEKGNSKITPLPKTQQEALNRIEIIKNALVGGERANDSQLKENRYKKKLAAQRRLSALAQALSRVEQSADRDLLQEHYSDIQHELRAKTESIKIYRQKIRALEREISDLQSEFQLDRADYLDTIRRLERNLKFYQQLLELAIPILRKDGKYWDPDIILQESTWNDDLRKWKLPEESMNRFKLPPAGTSDRYVIDAINGDSHEIANGGSSSEQSHLEEDNGDIAETYFRPRRTVELIHQRKGFNSWRDFTTRQQLTRSSSTLKTSWSNIAANSNSTNSVLASWLPQNHMNNNNNNGTGSSSTLSKTWCGLTVQTGFPALRPSPPTQQLASGQLLDTISTTSLPPSAANSPVLMSTDITGLLSRRRTRIKSTGQLVILGQQRRLRHVEMLERDWRINT